MGEGIWQGCHEPKTGQSYFGPPPGQRGCTMAKLVHVEKPKKDKCRLCKRQSLVKETWGNRKKAKYWGRLR